ncbi:MAG: hypothetical protein HWE30_17745 [Methylocystaceae bacterium]|nr:hypothetical protein [Methylocystaceae bacterium]
MRFNHEFSFQDYLDAGEETFKDIQNQKSPLVSAIVEYHDFITDGLWVGEVDMSPYQAFLSMNAFMVYLSAVRMAFTGQPAATFPLFRTALESACYAYMISQKEELGLIWSNRHKDEEALKLCRRKFTSAVSDTAKAVARNHGRPSNEAWINDCYQSAIDFGAHPNPKSIFENIGNPKDGGTHYIFELTGIYPAKSFQVSRSLMACLDYGMAIITILACGIKNPPSNISDELKRLNELKEQLTKDLFPETYKQMGPLSSYY